MSNLLVLSPTFLSFLKREEAHKEYQVNEELDESANTKFLQ